MSERKEVCGPDTADRSPVRPSQEGSGSKWQPIETAPLDLTEVFVWDGREVRLAQYEMHAKPPFWSTDVNDVAHGEDLERCIIHPTHWMPLPDGPA